ncbi:MAG: PIN domain-containing protein [Candidatus Pacearchaeota archaeon]|jgi:rRNA-processing protein FCF1
MIRVILDTNFLIYTAKEKMDYIEEIGRVLNEGFVPVVPKKVIEELNKLKNDYYKRVSLKDKMACDLALQLLEKNKVEVIDPPGNSVDKAIINLAKENPKNVVATLDREMRKKIGRVILLNKGHRLILTK